MNNGISAYRSALAQRVQAPQTDSASRLRAAESPKTVRELQESRAATADLSAEETSMIERYFPASEEMTLRIYGPGKGSANLNPGAVGGRLDIRG